MPEKQPQSSNRIRETLGRLYEHQPPHFREYIRRYQEDPTSRVFAPLAEAYRRLGRLDEAIDICLEGIKHHPDFPGGRVALARCFLDKKKFSKAKDELENVVGMSPDNILAQRLLGDCFFNLNEMVRALHCYKIASVLSPDDIGLQEKVHRLEQQLARGDFEVNSNTVNTPLVAPDLNPSESLLAIEEGTSADEEISVQPPAQTLAQIESFQRDSSLVGIEESAEEFELLGDESEESEVRRAQVDAILGFEEDETEESFKTESVNQIFTEEIKPTTEITTQTLGELYYSQGQYEKALKIFEKIQRNRASSELAQKIQMCRSQLGVDSTSLRRQQKIDALNAVLKKNRKNH